MGERPRVPGGQEHKRSVRSDKPRLGNCIPNVRSARAERGVALITVLIAVSFVSIIVIACITLVTMAARATSWSIERTKAFYAAEAGINHWLFEASIEESGAPHDRRHGGGHADRGCGHTHRRGAGHGGNPGGGGLGRGNHESQIETLEVSGEVNGVSYVAHVDRLLPDDLYRVVSSAGTSRLDVTVSVVVGPMSAAWRHVVYGCKWQPGWWEWLFHGLVITGPSQWDPSSGPHEAVWVKSTDVPRPIWSGEGQGAEVPDGYRLRVAPKIHDWSPPMDRVQDGVTEPGTLVLRGPGPFFLRNSKIGMIHASIDGDLYLLNCTVEKISGHIGGDILIKFENCNDRHVDTIEASVDGSVCVDTSGHESELPVITQIGSSETATTIAGAVYLRGRQPHGGLRVRDGIVFLGPNTREDAPQTTIKGGVFAEQGWLYAEGRVSISNKSAWPAVLSGSTVILNGSQGKIDVSGAVYSEGQAPLSLPEHSPKVEHLLEWLGLGGNAMPSVIMLGSNWSSTDSPQVTITGNVVTPGTPLLVGNVFVSYNRKLLTSPPPLFDDGTKVLAVVPGTWAVKH